MPNVNSHSSQDLLDATEDMLAMLDSNLRYTAVNRAYCQIFGQSHEFFLGNTIEAAFGHDPQHYKNVIFPIMQDCLAGEPFRYERWVEVPSFGNMYLDILYTPLNDPQGKIDSIVIVGRNRTEVMRSIEALKRSETLLNRTEHIASFGGWFYNVQNGSMQWTDEMYAIHEVGKDFVLTPERVNAFIPEPDLTMALASLQKTMQGQPSESTATLITANGNRKFVRSIAFPVIENGKVVSVEGILQDITEVTRIQNQLRLSEDKYRQLVEDTNVILWESDVPPAPPGFKYMSPQAEKITGYSMDELLQPNFLVNHVCQEDLQESFKTVLEKTAAREDFSIEYRLIRADNTAMWIHDEITLVYDELGAPQKLRGVMIDITRMKTMQSGLNKALRSLDNYKRILDQHAVVASTDASGYINFVNEKFVEISGYKREELLWKKHSILKSDLHPESFFQTLWNTISSGQVWQGEFCNRNKNGRLYWVYATIAPITDEGGNIESYISVCTDITELKRSEESLRRAQKMEAIGQLTGGIAHDFNNLLGIVIGNLELLELSLPNGTGGQSPLANAKNAAMRGSVLTRRLLNFSHQTPILGKALDLNAVMKSINFLISKSLTALVKVELNLSPELWQVDVDAGDFEDAIINLSINAGDAMPAGGTLRFTTRNYEASQVEFKNNSMIPAGKYVEILVEDTGIGMTAEVLEKIFEPYFTTKPSDKGSGLGLAMVYGFVIRSKGLIFVESNQGKGTRFSIYLPKSMHVIDKPYVDQRVVRQEKPTARSNETILVVDDEGEILNIARINLQKLGYRVLTSSNGDEALQVLQSSERIDLLFTDIVMPGKLNGFELAEEAIKLRVDLRVLFTTGYAKVENKVMRKDWTEALIQKPYRSDELSQKVRESLDKKGR